MSNFQTVKQITTIIGDNYLILVYVLPFCSHVIRY